MTRKSPRLDAARPRRADAEELKAKGLLCRADQLLPGSVLPEDSIPRDHQVSAPAGVFGNSPPFLVPFASNLQEARCLTLQPGFSLPCPALPCIPTFSAEPHPCPMPIYFITSKEPTGPPVLFHRSTLIPLPLPPPILFLLLTEQYEPSRPSLDHQEGK